MVSELTATKITALVNKQVKFDVHDLSERTYTHHIRNCSWLSVFYREKKSVAPGVAGKQKTFVIGRFPRPIEIWNTR